MSSHAVASTPSIMKNEDLRLFWGCFIALVTTAFGFIARMFLINTWADEFKLDPAKAGDRSFLQKLIDIGFYKKINAPTS